MRKLSSRFQQTGRLYRVQGSIHARIPASIGDVVQIRTRDGRRSVAEVIGFDKESVQLMPMIGGANFQEGDLVISTGQGVRLPVGEQMLGRVLNSSGFPIDDCGPLDNAYWVSGTAQTPGVLKRQNISQPFETGVRAIDGLLSVGKGQRVGIFAGSGVGKSTLLGQIARHAESDVNVVTLVGERGREVRPFIEESLGREGLRRSVVVVSTSDETPLSRIRAVESSIAIACWFRDQGANVLMMMDSLTRFANAQKELGLLLGEPPTTRGYPPSVFQKMAMILEQLGNSDRGTITGLITVLVDGDDMNEPVADSARSILDGHFVLSRAIAEKNHYPALDVLASISRLAREITSESQRNAVGSIKEIMSIYAEVEDVIRIGAYQPGVNPTTDGAIRCMPKINEFLTQGFEKSELNLTWQHLEELSQFCMQQVKVAA
ncbi:MAG: FliI/YscN family ATPase [Planctomycetota bacterium]